MLLTTCFLLGFYLALLQIIVLFMANRTTNKKEDMIKALKRNLGVVSLACKDMKISRWTHYNWYKTDAEYALKVDDINKVSTDFVEHQLLRLIKGYKFEEEKVFCNMGTITRTTVTKRVHPDVSAIIFYLKTKGRAAGYDQSTPLPEAPTNTPFYDTSKLTADEKKVLADIQRKLAG
jgi:hypothetical protein